MVKRKEMSTKEKYVQLTTLGKESYVSQAGIEKLLQAVKEDGLPEAFSRTTQWRARKAICSERTPYGMLVEQVNATTTNGHPATIAIQNPLAMLWKSVNVSDGFAGALAAGLEEHPSSRATPWKIIFYQDGVNPSDGLSKNHSRKSAAFYWSFLEFGMIALSKEEMWMTVSVVRETLVKHIAGKIAAIVAIIMKFFFDPNGYDIERCGVTLRKPNGTALEFFAHWGVLLCDEPALVEVLCSKGHSGTKPCVLCMNAVLHKAPHGSEPLHTHSDYATSIAVFDLKKFKKHTNESLRAAMLNLKEGSTTLGVGEFGLKQQLYGWNWSEHNLILNHRLQLKVVSVVMYDHAHIYLCEGLADVEFGLFMKHMQVERTRTTYAEFSNYHAGWKAPQQLPNCDRLFTPETNRIHLKNSHFSSSASEFLTVTPVLLLYLTRVSLVRDECTLFVQSMIAVLVVVELLQAVKRGVVSPDQLHDAIEKHLQLFLSAYGADLVRPKHHYALHLTRMLRFFGMLLATLTQERKHRLIRRYAQRRSNLTSWETGVVEDITCHALMDLKKKFMASALVKSHRPSSKIFNALHEMFPHVPAAAFMVARSTVSRNGCICVGDVIRITKDGANVAGKLLLNMSIGDEAYVVASIWRATTPQMLDPRVANFVVVDDVVVLPLSAVQCAVFYRMSDNCRACSVYVPFEYRPR